MKNIQCTQSKLKEFVLLKIHIHRHFHSFWIRNIWSIIPTDSVSDCLWRIFNIWVLSNFIGILDALIIRKFLYWGYGEDFSTTHNSPSFSFIQLLSLKPVLVLNTVSYNHLRPIDQLNKYLSCFWMYACLFSKYQFKVSWSIV